MKTYTVIDEHGKETTIEEKHMARHFRFVLLPILSELGLTPNHLSTYNDQPIQSLVSLIIAQIREYNSALQTARKEFKKLRDQREQDYETVIAFIKGLQIEEAPGNVVELKRKAA